ncbi:phosphodiesterase [Aquisphaera giovannonii]|uniref:Phosphoesterase n=1 Tax=Aquisphaera giovannonii TaxID=406548 RepID=A0A5B9WCX3_9BACT|nr:YfcE family phosphodiesterase [Aquisphaera giovannonii]QEH38518.1 phosphodiesterase [Aquisphaera giovannonii]
MKLGLISDIHGDFAALELAWAHLITMGVDRIACAGDVVGYGPFPDRVAAFLRERGIPSVRGNHDRWALERGPGAPCRFGGGTPSDETLGYLAGLPGDLAFELGGKVIVVVHGSPRSDMEFVGRDTHPPGVLDGYLEDIRCDVLVVGHTHRPMRYRGPSGGLVVNPGAVISAPVVETSRSFAVLDLEAGKVTHHRVEDGSPFDVEPWG